MAIVPFFTETSDLDRWDRCLGENSLWNMIFKEGSLFEPTPFQGSLEYPSESYTAWDSTPHEFLARDAKAIANTHVDWFETHDAHIVKADLPGLSKEDIQVIVEDERVLQIMGERKMDDEIVSGRNWHRAERTREGFLRRLQLPPNVKADEVKAQMENGVLSVTIPKRNTGDPSPTSQISIVQITE